MNRPTLNHAILPIFAASWLAAPAAHGHAILLHETPPAGARVAAAPAIALVFSEALELRFSSIAVTDGTGTRVDNGALAGDGHTVTQPLPPLKPGKYQVTWHAVSVDAHKSQGHYAFTVAP